CTSLLRVRANAIRGGSSGVRIAPGENLLPPAELNQDRVSVTGNTFEKLTSSGITMVGNAWVDNISGNVFRGISGATSLAAAVSLGPDGLYFPVLAKARANKFLGNDVGVRVEAGGGADQQYTIDFGNMQEDGQNVFRCNSSRGGGAPAGY